MKPASSQPRHFPIPMRWLYAGGDLTPSKRLDQRTNCSFLRAQGLPKSVLDAPGLACLHTPGLVVLASPAIEAGADMKSP
jgi:hypothetical protein